MKFQNIIESVYFKPWSITDAGWRDIHRIVKPHILGDALPENVKNFIGQNGGVEKFSAESNDCPDTDLFGQPIEQMEITPDGLAIIPIFGPLFNHASLMDRLCGACSYQQIQSDLLTAMATPGIKRVILNIGSPGGQCNGMAETSRRIMQVREAGIPIKAISDTCVGSAAYALASSCDSIAITWSAMVGSVGAFCALLDSSKAYEMQGMMVEVFKSGEMKGAGLDGTSLSPKQKSEFQKHADYFGEQFREIVRSTRTISEEHLQGQEFIGSDAIAAGFADEIIEDLGDGYSDDEGLG